MMIRYNPYCQGVRILTGIDPRPEGFSGSELRRVYYELTADEDAEGRILESADFAELDRVYSPGEAIPAVEFVLEAVTAKYGRIAQRMAAIGRVVGKSLGNDLSVTGTTEGKVKKQMGFATVMGSLNLSDGQTVSVVFHAPEGDREKVAKGETMVAFRFLLNNADITHVVAPRNMQEMTLETVGKRIGQLATENSAKFLAGKAKREAKAAELKAAQEKAAAAGAEADALNARVAELLEESDNLDLRIVQAEDRLAKIREENADLEAKIADMRAKAVEGGEETERTGGGDGSEEADPVTAFLEGTMRPELEGRGFNEYPENPDSTYHFEIKGKKANGKGKGDVRGIIFEYVFKFAGGQNANRFIVIYADNKKAIDHKRFESKTPRGLPGAFKKALAFADKYLKLMDREEPKPVDGGDADELPPETRAENEAFVPMLAKALEPYGFEDHDNGLFSLSVEGATIAVEFPPGGMLRVKEYKVGETPDKGQPFPPNKEGLNDLLNWVEDSIARAKGGGPEPLAGDGGVTDEQFDEAMKTMNRFMGKSQLSVVRSGAKGEEGDFFRDKMVELAERIGNMPGVRGQDGKGMDATAYLHYFVGASDWYITEKDGNGPQHQAYGFTILNGDTQMADLGYISIPEITGAGAELDFHFAPKRVGDVLTKRESSGNVPPETPASAVGREVVRIFEDLESKFGKYNASTVRDYNRVVKHLKSMGLHSNAADNIATDFHDYKAGQKTLNEAVASALDVLTRSGGTEDTTTPETPPAVQTLQDIIDGKYDDDAEALEAKLDEAAEELEAQGRMVEFDDLLNQAADRLTEAMEKEAA